MGKTTRHLLLLAGVAVLVLFINLGGPPLWDRDEPRNAACAREMMERGDWVVPTFNGELRVLKPAMKYWLMISAYQMFGVNEFAARFWSAVFAFAGAVATYFIGRRLFNQTAALWSALILLSSILFLMSGHLAKIDATLTFFSTLAMLIYVYFAFSPQKGTPEDRTDGAFTTPIPSTWSVWAMIYAAVGLAVLAKGLPGVIPVAALGIFLLIARLPRRMPEGAKPTRLQRLTAPLRPFAPVHFLRTFWSMRPLTAFVVVLAVAGPWYYLVGVRTEGEFLRGFFLEHHLGRAMEVMEYHNGPFLVYYIGAIVVGLFPWSVFLIAQMIWLVKRLRHDHPRRMACLLLTCWVGAYVFLFSCASTKLPGYITPCFPALALLMGALVEEIGAGVQASLRFWIKGSIASLGFIGLVLAIALTVAANCFFPGKEAFGLIGLILLVGAFAAFQFYSRGHSTVAVASLMTTAIAFNCACFGFGIVSLGNLQQQRNVCAVIHQNGAQVQFGALGVIEPSWVFYAKQPIKPICLMPTPNTVENRWKLQHVPVTEFFSEGPDQLIVTTDDNLRYLKPFLPEDAKVVARTPRFLRNGDWLIIGRTSLAAREPGYAQGR